MHTAEESWLLWDATWIREAGNNDSEASSGTGTRKGSINQANEEACK